MTEPARKWSASRREAWRSASAKYKAANREKIAAKAAAWREENRGRYLEISRRSYQKNKESRRARSAAWRKAHPELIRSMRRKTTIQAKGLTPAEHEQMTRVQEGLCAICRTPEKKKALAIDHCHSTGVVRGLLCAKCNKAIGLLRDDPWLLRSAVLYLERD